MTTPFIHDSEYTTLRKSLSLENYDEGAFFEPSSSIIFVNDESKKTLNHELIHVNQLSSTTAGIVMTTFMALRAATVENYIRNLNSDFNSGLWVPIKGWLADIYTDQNDFYDDTKPYYFVSSMKRLIGQIDSSLYSIGAFESIKEEDIVYWMDRFAWKSLYDNSWKSAFNRSPWRGGFWPFGITSLFEACAVYIELLNETGSIAITNEVLHEKIQHAKLIHKNNLRLNQGFMGYFGPFLIIEEYGCLPSKNPYHLIPIATFWALQAPLPLPGFSDNIKSRSNPRKFSWAEVDPGNLFYTIFGEAADDLRGRSLSCSLQELASSVSYGFWNGENKLTMPAETISEDIIFVDSFKEYAKDVAPCLDVTFSRCFPKTLEDRINMFFEYPQNKEIPVPVSSPTNSVPHENAAAYLMSHIAEHIIPLWSYGKLPRFRFGQRLFCPSSPGMALENICPMKGKCDGGFPDTTNLPKTCWFQETLMDRLSLNIDRIGIVPGEFASEDEVSKYF
jgi:hypothetical protein